MVCVNRARIGTTACGREYQFGWHMACCSRRARIPGGVNAIPSLLQRLTCQPVPLPVACSLPTAVPHLLASVGAPRGANATGSACGPALASVLYACVYFVCRNAGGSGCMPTIRCWPGCITGRLQLRALALLPLRRTYCGCIPRQLL